MIRVSAVFCSMWRMWTKDRLKSDIQTPFAYYLVLFFKTISILSRIKEREETYQNKNTNKDIKNFRLRKMIYKRHSQVLDIHVFLNYTNRQRQRLARISS